MRMSQGSMSNTGQEMGLSALDHQDTIAGPEESMGA